MKSITNISLMICLALVASCLSGSKKMLTKDVSGLKEIIFSFRVSKSVGHESKDVLINFSDVDKPCKMYIENKGSKEHRVTWWKEDHGGDYQLKPGDKKEIYDGPSSRLNFVIYDLSYAKTDMIITINFEKDLPEDTEMRVRLVWADGP